MDTERQRVSLEKTIVFEDAEGQGVHEKTVGFVGWDRSLERHQRSWIMVHLSGRSENCEL